MSAEIEIVRDGIGEVREALFQDGRAISLRVARASDAGRRARWGEVYAARVTRVARARRGAFVDLGLNEDEGFLPFDAGGKALKGRARIDIREGQGVVARITREAARGKNPVLALVDAEHPGGASARVDIPECDAVLAGARPADISARRRIDEAIDDALARVAPIPGGGLLTIEPCAALVAVDVDSGARQGGGDPERFALDLNTAAAREIARQVRLRGLGGVIAIDFVSLRRNADRARLVQEVKAAFAGDPWGARMGMLSSFGVFELTRAQLRAPLHETLREDGGAARTETLALAALRAIEREAMASPGRKIACTVAAPVKTWLETTDLEWRAALTGRMGARWSIEGPLANAYWPSEKIDARAL